MQVVLVVVLVVLAMNLASLNRKAGSKLLSGPSKSGRASITPPMKVSLGCNVIKIRATKPSSPSYGVSPVESMRLESKDQKFSQMPGSEGHPTNGQAMLSITQAATSTRLQWLTSKRIWLRLTINQLLPFHLLLIR